jgi:hypothetical protein
VACRRFVPGGVATGVRPVRSNLGMWSSRPQPPGRHPGSERRGPRRSGRLTGGRAWLTLPVEADERADGTTPAAPGLGLLPPETCSGTARGGPWAGERTGGVAPACRRRDDPKAGAVAAAARPERRGPRTVRRGPRIARPSPRPTGPAPRSTGPVPRPARPVPRPTEPVSRPTEPVSRPTEPVPRPTGPVPRPTGPAPVRLGPRRRERRSSSSTGPTGRRERGRRRRERAPARRERAPAGRRDEGLVFQDEPLVPQDGPLW